MFCAQVNMNTDMVSKTVYQRLRKWLNSEHRKNGTVIKVKKKLASFHQTSPETYYTRFKSLFQTEVIGVLTSTKKHGFSYPCCCLSCCTAYYDHRVKTKNVHPRNLLQT